jgi:chromosome segregation ATPase
MGELAECRVVNEKAIETLAVYAERLSVIETDVKDIKKIILTGDDN